MLVTPHIGAETARDNCRFCMTGMPPVHGFDAGAVAALASGQNAACGDLGLAAQIGVQRGGQGD